VSAVFLVIAPRLLGPALVVAAALLVKGYTDVGDGFSAGVIVGLAVALRYVTLGPAQTERELPVLRLAPYGVPAGIILALTVGFAPVLGGDPPFTHVPGPGESVTKIGSLELITAVAFDVGVFLLVVSALVLLIHHLSSLVLREDGR
jgi:multisubunit Na+/H+ antiporter MnhB subunit